MTPRVLMIENDADDRLLTEETFQAEGVNVHIDFIYSTELAAALQHAAPPPQLILLNINAQPFHGVDLIRIIRSTEGYEPVPIVVLSETVLMEEVQAAYDAGASSFIQKPASYSDTLFKIKSFINYWFRTVVLPAPEREKAGGATR